MHHFNHVSTSNFFQASKDCHECGIMYSGLFHSCMATDSRTDKQLCCNHTQCGSPLTALLFATPTII